MLERRLFPGFRMAATSAPGLVLTTSGLIVLVCPDGTRVKLDGTPAPAGTIEARFQTGPLEEPTELAGLVLLADGTVEMIGARGVRTRISANPGRLEARFVTGFLEETVGGPGLAVNGNDTVAVAGSRTVLEELPTCTAAAVAASTSIAGAGYALPDGVTLPHYLYPSNRRAVTFTAREAGAAGNDITISYDKPDAGGNPGGLVVEVDGLAITFLLGPDTTNEQIVAAIMDTGDVSYSAAAAALVSAHRNTTVSPPLEILPGMYQSDGNLVATNLTGGVEAEVSMVEFTLGFGANQSGVNGQDILAGNIRDTDVPIAVPDVFPGSQFTVAERDLGALGNLRYGDCVWAGFDHQVMFWTAAATGRPAQFEVFNTLSDYSNATGFLVEDAENTDNGTTVRQGLSYWQQTGVLDADGGRHKIGAYVRADLTWEQLLELTYVFGSVGLAFNCPFWAINQWQRGVEWEFTPGDDLEPSAGHYVPVVGRPTLDTVDVITWGTYQRMNRSFFEQFAVEAWVAVTPDILEAETSASPGGYSMAELRAILADL